MKRRGKRFIGELQDVLSVKVSASVGSNGFARQEQEEQEQDEDEDEEEEEEEGRCGGRAYKRLPREGLGVKRARAPEAT